MLILALYIILNFISKEDKMQEYLSFSNMKYKIMIDMKSSTVAEKHDMRFLIDSYHVKFNYA